MKLQQLEPPEALCLLYEHSFSRFLVFGLYGPKW